MDDKLLFHLDHSLTQSSNSLTFTISLKKGAPPSSKFALQRAIDDRHPRGIFLKTLLLNHLLEEAGEKKEALFSSGKGRISSFLRELFAAGEIDLKGRLIVPSLFSQGVIKAEVLSSEESMVVISYLWWGGKKHPLQREFLFLEGDQRFLIAEGVLFPIDSPLPRKSLQSYLDKSEREFTPVEGRKALLEWEEEYIERVEIAPSKEVEERGEMALPLILLKDGRGLFVDLLFRYEDRGEIVRYGEPHRSFRNRKEENFWREQLLIHYRDEGERGFYCPSTNIGQAINFYLKEGWELLDRDRRLIRRYENHDLSLTTRADALVVEGALSFGGKELLVEEVFSLREKKMVLAPLKEGGFALLAGERFERDLSSLEREALFIGERVMLSKASLLKPLSTVRTMVGRCSRDVQAIEEEFGDIDQEGGEGGGAAFRGELREYQRKAVAWLLLRYKLRYGAILADEMGLGKSVQFLAFLSRIELKKPILLIVPKSLIKNWQREFQTFLPSITPFIHGEGGEMNFFEGIEGKQLLLLSYTSLRIHQARFQEIHFQMVVLDESQTIKNPKAQISEVVASLRSDFRLCLTATPFENSAMDMASHVKFLHPEQQRLFGEKNPLFWQDHIPAFLLRRRKSEVAKELPPLIENDLFLEMETEQKELYESLQRGFKEKLLKKIDSLSGEERRVEVLEAILRLRQMACHPQLVPSFAKGSMASIKMDVLLEDVRKLIEDGGKGIIYSQFTKLLDLLGEELKKRNFDYLRLDGQTRQRQEIVDAFQNSEKPLLFLISIKAGGVGLNLQKADAVFLFDPWWNEAVEAQAIHRAHRIGRLSPVVARRYIVAGTIEERVFDLKKRKKELSDLFVEESQGASLSLETLLDLL